MIPPAVLLPRRRSLLGVLFCLFLFVSGSLAEEVPPSAEPLETFELVGELLALGPRLHDLSVTPEEREALNGGLREGFSFEEAPESVGEEFEAVIAQMREKWILSDIEDEQPEPLGLETARIVGLLSARFSGIPPSLLTDEQIDAIARGFDQTIDQDGMSTRLRARLPEVFDFLDSVAGPSSIALGQLVAPDEYSFFVTLREEDAVQFDRDGLHWKIIDAGVGSPPGPRDLVTVHYEGSLVSGEVFDSSFERGEPVDFPMNGVIPGFSRGLQKIGVGGKVIIYIPGELGYGKRPPAGSPIGPGDTLIFDAELIDVQRNDS